MNGLCEVKRQFVDSRLSHQSSVCCEVRYMGVMTKWQENTTFLQSRYFNVVGTHQFKCSTEVNNSTMNSLKSSVWIDHLKLPKVFEMNDRIFIKHLYANRNRNEHWFGLTKHVIEKEGRKQDRY